MVSLSHLLVVAGLVLQPVQAARPGAKAELKLTNARLTYGEFGATRAEAKFLPGDTFYTAFDIEGIKVDPDGKVSYTMGIELTDPKGVPVLKKAPVEREEILTLGGDRLPARTYIILGTDSPPGIYTFRASVFDRGTGASKTLEQKIEILPRNLGLINVLYSFDQNGQMASPPAGTAGQTLWLQCTIAGFERGGPKKQPNLEIEMIAYERGRQVLSKPVKYPVDDNVAAEVPVLPFQFLVPLSRAGDFTLELKVTDKVSKKVATTTLPLRVHSAADR